MAGGGRIGLRIFVSSPGDVVDERRVALRVMARLKGEYGAVVDIEPIVWEHEPIRATATFQDQIPPPSDTDALLCILWSRLGTRLPSDYRRSDGSVYDSGTAYELETALESFQRGGRPDILVYRKTAPPLFNVADREERDLRARQWDQLADYLQSWFQNPDGSFRAGFTQFERLDEFEEVLERHLRRLVRDRIDQAGIAVAGDDLSAATWLSGSPFLGLRAFDADHAEVFHGRTRAIAEVKDRIQRHAAEGTAFLLVTGMSGSGKSSLVRAGLVPALTTPGAVEGIGLWRLAEMRPTGGETLLEALTAALFLPDALPELGESDFDTPAALAGLVAANPEQALKPIGRGLERAARKVQEAEKLGRAPATRLLLVVDQLEEIFVRDDVTPEDRAHFAAVLKAFAESGLVFVIATLRSDFYHRLAELPDLAALKDGLGAYDLLPPTTTEIGQMIRNPARAAGLAFECHERRGRLDDVMQDAAASDPASLPMLSFVLDELYQEVAPARELTFAAYDRVGGLEGAIAARAASVLAAQAERVQEAAPALIRSMVALASGRPAARTVPRREVATSDAASELLDALIAARLVVTGEAAAAPTVRLAHEALLSRWPLAQTTIEESLEFLQARGRVASEAVRWLREARNPELLLPPGIRLAEAEALLLPRKAELDPDLADYVEASITAEAERVASEQAQARRKLRRTQAAAAVMGILAVLAGLAGFEAYTQSARARLEAAEAARQKAIAESQAAEATAARAAAEESAEEARAAQAVAEEARLEAEQSRDRALAAEKAAKDLAAAATREKSRAERLAIDAMSATAEASLKDDPLAGAMIAVEAAQHSLRRLSRIDPRVAALLSRATAALVGTSGAEVVQGEMTASGEGRAAVTADGRLLLHDFRAASASVGSPDGVGFRSVHILPGYEIVHAVTRDGAVLAYALHTRDPAGTREPAFDIDHDGPVSALAHSTGGEMLALGTANGIELRHGGKIVRRFGEDLDRIAHLAFTPDDLGLLAVGANGELRLVELLTGREHDLPALGGPATAIAISPDGRLGAFAAGSTLKVYDLTSRQWQFSREFDEALHSLAFSPDGRGLLVQDAKRAVRRYDLDRAVLGDAVAAPFLGQLAVASRSPYGVALIGEDRAGDLSTWSSDPVAAVVAACEALRDATPPQEVNQETAVVVADVCRQLVWSVTDAPSGGEGIAWLMAHDDLAEGRDRGEYHWLRALQDDDRDAFGRNILLAAAAQPQGRPEIVRLLVENDADIETVDAHGRTPLIVAATHAPPEVVSLLLDGGARRDASDDQGRTALHWAVARGERRIVELLIAAGADVVSADYDGDTPLSLARRRAEPALADLLLAAGATEAAAVPEPSEPWNPDYLVPESALPATRQGLALELGPGGPERFEAANDRYREAAAAGDGFAMYLLSRAYRFGHGVERDPSLAFEWAARSAETGDSHGLNELGSALAGGSGGAADPGRALELWRRSAALGNRRAMSNLGDAYMYGYHGVTADPAAGAAWFEKAIALEHGYSMTELAWNLQNGRLGRPDYARAHELFRRAAQQGERDAMFFLAEFYEQGMPQIGLERDLERAIELYRQAALLDRVSAMPRLAWFLETGTGVERDFAAAARWYRRAAKRGDATAASKFADMLADQQLVFGTPHEIRHWSRRAGTTASHRDATVLSERIGDLTLKLARARLEAVLPIEGAPAQRIVYDSAGHVVREETPDKVRHFTYHELFGKITSVVEISRATGQRQQVAFEYDLAGNLVRAADNEGLAVGLSYDGDRRIAEMRASDGDVLQFGYDAASKKPSRIVLVGVGSIDVSYDGNGEIENVESDGGREMALRVAGAFQRLLMLTRRADVDL